MHGIIKCLTGQLKVTSFTRRAAPSRASLPDRFMRSSHLMEQLLRGDLFLAEQLQPAKQMTTGSGSCVLEPEAANIHTIESVGGPAAFLDILAPPYNLEPGPGSEDPQERDCHYYTVLPDPGPSPNLHWLVLTPPPPTFFCDTEPYRGPPVEDH
jgi:cysteamine dioxygenase